MGAIAGGCGRGRGRGRGRWSSLRPRPRLPSRPSAALAGRGLGPPIAGNSDGGGRFPRGGYGVAPPIHLVPPPSHFAGSRAAGSPGWRGSPSGQPGNGWRGSPSAPRSSAAPVPPAATYRAATPAAPAGHGWSGSPGGAARPAAPSFSAPAARSFGGGGFSRGGGGFSRGGGGRRR